MKAIMLLKQSLDGFLSKGQEDTLQWGSKEDLEFFRSKTIAVGVMILGSKTYEAMPARAFGKRRVVVMTRSPERYESDPKLSQVPSSGSVEFTGLDPKGVLEQLSKDSFQEVVIAGGGEINGMFLEAGLVDEVYVTIVPKIFGQGIKSFSDRDFGLDLDLELLEVKPLTEQEMLFRYRVIK